MFLYELGRAENSDAGETRGKAVLSLCILHLSSET